MNRTKKITASILIVLVFLCLFVPKVKANFFTDDWEGEEQNAIEEAIDNDEGGIFEKIIAQMIGGIAQTIFDLTTQEELGVGFKNYDELIFARGLTAISPFTQEQWNSMMEWYKKMSAITGSLILIVVVVIAFKIMIGSYSIEKRNEAKDSLMRLFFGAASIVFAPLFVKFLLFLNNNLVHMLVGYSDRSLEQLLGNNVISNIQTGNAIATAIVISLFAYLFFKLNVKFIIRQFTILIFTIFTPIISIMWIINKRTIGASIWFGQILINVFMQFIYAFLFLIYMEFLPEAGGWATSILWAMMILPLANTLQNTLQNLISRIAGIDNDDLANRGIGMAGQMAHSIKAIAYQFKGTNNITSFIGKKDVESISPMKVTKMETIPMQTTNIMQSFKKDTNDISKIGKAAASTSKELMNIGKYAADGDKKWQQKDI